MLDFLYQSRKEDCCGKVAGPPGVVSRYAMRTRDGRELSNSLNIIFMELPQAVGLEGSLESNTALENWAIFFKDADNPEKQGIIDKLAGTEEGLMQAQKSLRAISENRDLWIAQYRQDLYETDRISSMYAAEQRGRNEGRNEGLRQSACNALKMGLSAEQVSKITGLSVQEIQKLPL